MSAGGAVRRRWSGRSTVALALVMLACAALPVGAAPRSTKKAAAAKKSAAAAKVLATVGGTAITQADYDARLAELPPQYKTQVTTAEQKHQFLDRLIEEKIWLEAAVRAKVEERPDVERQLASQRRDVLIRTYLGEKMQQAPAPSDSSLLAFYQANQSQFMTEEQVKVRHIQVKDEKAAKVVGKELAKSGADFAALAQKYSADTVTKEKGGDLGLVGRSGFFGSLGQQRALADTAFAIPPNHVVGPLKTGVGLHFIEVTEKVAAHPRPFEEVKPVLLRQIGQQANQDYYKATLAETRAALGVTVDSAAVDALANAQKSAVEMFREAGETASPDERVVAYKRLADTYPESEYAPQSLFMVGFVESEEKRDYDQAETAFKMLLTRYPKSELASSAQWMIDNMRSDKTPDFELPGGMGKASEHDAPERGLEITPPTGKP